MLQQCVEGKIKRLIINIPPRNLKSHCVSICLPAYILGHNPSARIICASYSQTLASNFSRKTRQLMETDFYKNVFKTRLGDKNTESEFDTTENGCRYSTSTDGTLTGIGGNYIFIDDPIKAADANSETIRNKVNEWYDNTVVSRLNDKVNGCIIVVMQRLHIDDLTGHLLKQDGWEVLKLPAIAEADESFELSTGKIVRRKAGAALHPELEPVEILENHKKTMSSYNFSAQYQQNPIPEKGNVIDFNDFSFFDSNLDLSQATTFQSWDIALKDGKDNDYSVCVTGKLERDILYIQDIRRFKLDIYNLINEMHRLKETLKASYVIVEDTSVTVHLQQLIDFYTYKYKPRGDKIVRANSASFYIKSGRVKLLNNTAWIDEFRAEINAFPNGKHDDQVDTLSQLIDFTLNGFHQFNMVEIAMALKERMQKPLAQMNRTEFCNFARRQYLQKPKFNIPKF